MALTRIIPQRIRDFLYEYRHLWGVQRDIVDGYRWTFEAQEIPPVAVAAADGNPIETFFDTNLTGPGIWKWRHYFDAYHRHLAPFRGTPVHVLEIGIYSGGSLRMWRDYFGPAASIYGVDIEEACRVYETDGTRVFIGDQADPRFWQRFRSAVPSLDVVIDDGGHQPDQQITTLRELLPHLRPGGIYICEDVHHGVRRRFHRFHAYLYGLAQHLHVVHGADGEDHPTTPTQRAIAGIHQYPSLFVIERTRDPRAQLFSEKRGTEWAPFALR